MSKLTFNQIRQALNKQRPETQFEGVILALDPGETTGVAAFTCTADEAVLTHASQIKTWPLEIGVKTLEDLIKAVKPDRVVFESYQVYEWKSESHSWSQIPTVQVIGMIKVLLIMHGIDYTTQTAQAAKNFCTDKKLEEWGFWQQGLRHARDACRHACYFLLFGPSKNS